MPNGGSESPAGGGRSVDSFKKTFFNPNAVLDPAERALQRQLSRFGAFVRRRAQTSIRYRDKPAAVGSPPSAHRTMVRLKPAKRKSKTTTASGKRQMSSPLRDFLFFGYERADQTVVIGPAKTNQTQDAGGRPVSGTVPQVEEEGGQVSVFEVRKNGRWVRADMRSTRRLAGLPTRTRVVTIGPHPYMKPAYDAELSGFLGSLKDSITPT